MQLVAGDWVLADTVEARLGTAEICFQHRGSGGVSWKPAARQPADVRPDSGDVDLAGPGVVLQFDGSRLVTDGLLRLDTGPSALPSMALCAAVG